MQKNKYESYTDDQLNELFSNFLIDSWSYSKVSTFARNEKAFEQQYIYNEPFRTAASTEAGSAYHSALQAYFNNLIEGNILDVIDLERVAFDYIDEVPNNRWKLQKTTPTVDECIKVATKTASALIQNFMKEVSIYTDDMKEILAVEKYIDQWLTINGVDIPMPCHMQIDEAIRTNDDKIALIDHKSKRSFSDEKENAFTIGKQAITYALGFEKETGLTVDEVWFIENKYSKNKDGSPQLKATKVKLDLDTRRLYEAQLYEPLRRMIEAVRDPDYVYLINDSDNFVDKAEIQAFWAKTMIAEVDEFNIHVDKIELIEKRLNKIRNVEVANVSPTVIKNFKRSAANFISYDFNSKDMTKSEKLVHVLSSFGVAVNVAHEFKGYSSDTLLLEVGVGVKVASVIARKKDIANALDVKFIRINDALFVYEGKSYVSVEIPKISKEVLYYDEKYLSGMKIPIGLDNFKEPVYWDLDNPSTPHVLVCGATGSGKTVSIISTIEFIKSAGINNIIVFDPKYEFKELNISGVEIYSDIDDIETMMRMLVDDMQDRKKTGKKGKTVIIFDELAEAIANSKKGNELKIYENQIIGNYANGSPKTKRIHTGTLVSLEKNLQMILQLGRSLGFRVMSATQRASVKVINGDAKVNFPVQICFKVPKEIDSKVVIDEPGGESLSGKGDGLIKSPEYLNTIRFQAFYKA